MRYTFISAFVSDGMYMLCKLLNSTDNSHYTRGEITFASRKHVLNPVIKWPYFLFSGYKVGNQDQSCAPHVCCMSCSSKHKAWVNSKGCSTLFSVPMIRKEPTNYLKGCYFCILPPNQTVLPTRKSWQRSTQIYNRLCVQCLVWRSAYSRMPWELIPGLWWGRGEYTQKYKQPTSRGLEFFLNVTSTEPCNITKKELVRDLEWSNNNAELLPSRLQQWNRLDDNVKVTAFHSSEKIFSSSS